MHLTLYNDKNNNINILLDTSSATDANNTRVVQNRVLIITIGRHDNSFATDIIVIGSRRERAISIRECDEQKTVGESYRAIPSQFMIASGSLIFVP